MATSTVIQDFGSSVYGFQVNGYVFQATTTAPTTSSTNTGPTTTQASTGTPHSSSLSQGTKIGIGVGVSLGVIGLLSLLAALFLVRRYRRKRQPDVLVPPMEHTPAYTETPELSNTDRFSQRPTINPGLSTRASIPQGMPPQQSEMVWEDANGAEASKDGTSPQNGRSHEMSATPQGPLSLPTVDRE